MDDNGYRTDLVYQHIDRRYVRVAPGIYMYCGNNGSHGKIWTFFSTPPGALLVYCDTCTEILMIKSLIFYSYSYKMIKMYKAFGKSHGNADIIYYHTLSLSYI